MWDTTTGKCLFKNAYSRGSEPVAAVAWTADGKKLAAAHSPKTLIYDEQGTELQRLESDDHVCERLAWSPDGSQLLSGGNDQTVRLWNANSTKAARTIRVHAGSIASVAWAPDGKVLLTLSQASGLRLVSLTNRQESAQYSYLGQPVVVNHVTWSPDGKWLACPSGIAPKDGAILDGKTGHVRHWLWGLKNSWSVAWSPDSSQIAGLEYMAPGQVKFWDANTGQPIRVIRVNEHKDGGNTTVAWSPDGAWTATGTTNSTPTVRLQEAANGQVKFSVGDRGLNRCVFSPNGRILAGTGSGFTALWEVPSGKQLMRISEGTQQDLAWSPDGKYLALAASGEFSILRAEDGKVVHRVLAHKGRVYGVHWSPDGRRIATASLDGTVKIWDAATLDHLMTFPYRGPMRGVNWSPDGKRLAACNEAGGVYIWGSLDMPVLPKSADYLETGVLASCKTIAEELREEEAKFVAKTRAQPKNGKVWQDLAVFHQLYRHWDKAAAAWDRGVQLAPKSPYWYGLAAQVHLMAGNDQTFQDYRAKAIGLLQGTSVADVRNYARVCSLSPGGGHDFLLEPTQEAAKKEPDNWWTAYVPGTILYRTGRYAEARDVFERAHKVTDVGDKPGQCVVKLWLAMTYQHLHESDKAKTFLAEANRRVDDWSPRPGEALNQYHPGYFIESRILQKEATALILGKDVPVGQPVAAPETKRQPTLEDELAHPDGVVARLDLAELQIAGMSFESAADTITKAERQLEQLSAQYSNDEQLEPHQLRAQDLRKRAAESALRSQAFDPPAIAARITAAPLSLSALQPVEATSALHSSGIIRWEAGKLTRDCDPDLVRKACFARVYELPLETGTVYSIDVQSRQFDAFVRLENSRGSNLFVDDNSGGGGNARLLFRVSASGVYRVVVTSFEPDATGNFVLTVRRASAPDKASSE